MASPESPVAITCKYCLNEQIRTCLMCKSRFCVLHAAKFSPNFCQDCLSNIGVIRNIVTRTSVEYDMIDDQILPKVIHAPTLQLDGPDWVFYQAWLAERTEEEWMDVYQFHYFILKYMEYENELRKVKQTRRIQSATVGTRSPQTPRPRKIMSGPEVQASMEKAGFDATAIKAMMAAVGFTYKEHPTNGTGN